MNRSSADLIIPLKQCLLNMRERTILIFHIVVMISDANLEVGVIFQADIWDAPTKNITYDLQCSQHHIQGSDVHLIAGLVSNLSENGVIGMIAFTSCPVAAVLETKSKEINLPLINIVNSICPESLNRHRSFIFSNCFLQNSIVMSLVQLMQWQRINIIYDSSSDLCIQRLVNLLSVQNISSSAIYLYNGLGFIREWFQRLWLNEVFYVTADREATLRIISEAMSSDMFNRGYHWVLNLDPKELLNNSIYEPLHNGNVLLVFPYNERKETAIVSLQWEYLALSPREISVHIEVLTFLGSNGLAAVRISCQLPLIRSYPPFKRIIRQKRYIQPGFTAYASWLLEKKTTGNLLDDALSTFSRGLNAIDESNSTNIISLRNDLQESLSREFHNLSAKWKEQASARVLSSVRNNKTPFQEVAVYSQTDESLHLIEKDCLYKNDFKDFGNRALKVVSVVGEPFQMRVDKGNGSFYYHGFTYDLLDEFAKKFNFRYEFLDSVDGLYGNPTDDGQNASGMVGMVMRGEADIAVGGFTITAERRKVVDFIYPFQEEGIGIIMQKVDKLADEMFRVFSPFEIDSWIATIAAVFVAAAVLSLIVKFSPFSRKLHSEVSTSFWVAFSAFLQQGEEKAPNSIPGRVVLGIWWIFTIIIMSLYTANLAAFLTISMARVPIKNLEELASQRVYKPLVKDGTNLYMLFKDAEGGVYKKIWDMMADAPKIITPDEGYNMIVQGKYAYMTDESETRYKAMVDCKNLEMADETFHKAELSFVIQKNAEFKEAFNEHMLKMVQSGIVDKYKKKWWPNIDCHSTNTANELAFQSTSGIFIVYSGFILISVICCIAELLIYRRKNEKNKVDSSEETIDANSIVMVDLK